MPRSSYRKHQSFAQATDDGATAQMRTAWQRWIARVVTILAFAGAASRALAQRVAQDVEPKWFRAHFTGASVGAYVEGTQEEANYRGGISSTFSRWFEGPLFGIGM